MESMVPKEEYETQKRELNSELETAQSKAERSQKEGDQLVEREKALAGGFYEAKLASRRGELEEETTEMKVLEEEKTKLARALGVAGKALKHLPDYPHDADEIACAKGSLPLRPDADGGVHAAIVHDSSIDILTPGLQAAVSAFQTQISMRGMGSMQMAAAAKMARDEVAECWKKVQVFASQPVGQRNLKHNLLVENHSELLKTKNTVTRMGARPSTRTCSSPAMLATSAHRTGRWRAAKVLLLVAAATITAPPAVVFAADWCDTAVDLAALASPVTGTLAGKADLFAGCGEGPEALYKLELPPGAALRIRQTVNDFDSRHGWWIGPECPGSAADLAGCVDEPDEGWAWISNTGAAPTTAWYFVTRYESGGSGDFALEWYLPRAADRCVIVPDADGNVVIPAEWESIPQREVSGESFGGFEGCQELKTIDWTQNTKITTLSGTNTFKDCVSLTSTGLAGSQVKTISGTSTFAGCSALTSTELAASQVTTFILPGHSTFRGCSALTSTGLAGSRVATISGGNHFDECGSLTSTGLGGLASLAYRSHPDRITVPANAAGEDDIFGDICQGRIVLGTSDSGRVFFDTSDTCSNCGITPDADGRVVIPAEWTRIRSLAFRDCKELKTIDWSQNTKITELDGDDMFRGCSSLTSTGLAGSQITTISGSRIFADCSALTSTGLAGSQVTTISDLNTFDGSPVLWDDECAVAPDAAGHVVIPAEWGRLPPYAFYRCLSLKTIDWTQNTKITELVGYNTFAGCGALTSTGLAGSKVTTIGGHSAFLECSSLASTELAGSQVSTISGSWIFADCSALTSTGLAGSQVNTISGEAVFAGCGSLTSTGLGGSSNPAYSRHPDYITVTGTGTFFSKSPQLPGANSPMRISDCGIAPDADGRVVIPAEWTRIHGLAFRDCKELKTIDWSQNTKITELAGNDMFRGCSSLTSTGLAGSQVTTISGDGTFADCASLLSTGLADSKVNKLSGDETFRGCSSLPSTGLPGSFITELDGAGTFRDCTSLASTGLDGSLVARIGGADTFSGCAALTATELAGSKITVLGGDNTFAGCTALRSTGLARSRVAEIAGDGMYSDCAALASSELARSQVAAITGSGTFRRCASLAETGLADSQITAIRGDYTFQGCRSLTSTGLAGSQVTTISGHSTFLGCASLASTGLAGSRVATISGGWTFQDCVALTSTGLGGAWRQAHDGRAGYIAVTDKDTQFLGAPAATIDCGIVPDADGRVVIPAGWTRIAGGAFQDCAGLKTIDWSQNTRITELAGDDTFRGCTALTSTGLSSSQVASIRGEHTFSGCSSLLATELAGSRVATVGNSTFHGCVALTSTGLDGSAVSRLGPSSFEGCAALTGATGIASTPIVAIEDKTFKGCRKLEATGLADSNVTGLGASAFEGCAALTTTEMDGSQISDLSGDRAFAGCASLALTGLAGSPITTISGGNVFAGCTALQSTGLAASQVAALTGAAAFRGCSALVSTDLIATAIAEVPPRTFEDCTALRSTGLGGSKVEKIGGSAYKGCTGLTEDVVAAGALVAAIGDRAFEGCTNLTSLDTTNAPRLRSIGVSAFERCSGLTALYLGPGVTLGTRAFAAASALCDFAIDAGATFETTDAFNGAGVECKPESCAATQYSPGRSTQGKLCPCGVCPAGVALVAPPSPTMEPTFAPTLNYTTFVAPAAAAAYSQTFAAAEEGSTAPSASQALAFLAALFVLLLLLIILFFCIGAAPAAPAANDENPMSVVENPMYDSAAAAAQAAGQPATADVAGGAGAASVGGGKAAAATLGGAASSVVRWLLRQLQAALVAQQLEFRTPRSGVAGTGAARLLAIVVMAVVFQSAVDSKAENTLVEVLNVPEGACYVHLCHLEKSTAGELCDCHAARDPVVYGSGCIAHNKSDGTQRIYSGFDAALCVEIKSGAVEEDAPGDSCGVYNKTEHPFVFEAKRLNPTHTMICTKTVTTNTFSTTEVFGIALGYAEVVYLGLLWVFKMTSRRVVPDQVREDVAEVAGEKDFPLTKELSQLTSNSQSLESRLTKELEALQAQLDTLVAGGGSTSPAAGNKHHAHLRAAAGPGPSGVLALEDAFEGFNNKMADL